MATFKAEVYAHQKRADGTYNIKIRVIHNKRKKYLSTVWYIEKDDMTRSLKIKNQKYIDLTDELIRKYRHKCDQVGEALKSMSVEEVVDLIKSEDTDSFRLDIVKYTYKYIEELKRTGHEGTALIYKSSIKSLTKFVGREEISYKEITAKLVNEWISWLQENACRDKSRCRSKIVYPVCLKAMYNRAKKEFNDEDYGIIRIPYSPFSKVEIPKEPVIKKRAIEIEKIQAISKLEYRERLYDKSRFNIARDIFLLSFCLVGMNAVDLYNCTNYKDGRITYQRTKTKNRRADHAEISIFVEPEIQQIFDKYRDPTGERVFSFYRHFNSVNSFSSCVNKGLKVIGEAIGVPGLNMYAARHSWATIAANDAGVDRYTVHMALNHSDSSMKITDIYIKKSWKPIDEANRKVLDLLKFNIEVKDEPTYVPVRLRRENEKE